MGDSSHTRGSRRNRPAAPGSAVLTPPVGLPAVPAPAVPAQRAAEDLRPAVPPPAVVQPCACGHARAAHQHYRRGTDCGACGSAGCAEYRREGGPVRRTLRRWGLVA